MHPDVVERKLAAISSADVAGYSRLMASDEVGIVRALQAAREHIAIVIRQYRGRVVDSPGDNLLAEFPSALDAVRCAVEVRRVLHARSADVPIDRRMEFRVGVHLGDVMVECERIYGEGINIAARLETLADPGGICLSAPVWEQMRHKVGLAVEDLDRLPDLGEILVIAGIGLFALGFGQVYWAKVRGPGLVTRLALVGLGAFLVWPRVLVLVMYLTMLFLYALLARREEARCSELFGETYRAYQRRTGMFLPRPLPRLGRWPASRRARVAAVLGLYVLAVVGGVGLAYRVRDYSLSKLSALFEDDMAVLSPARLSADELRGETWSIADLPLDLPSAATHPGTDRGHRVPSNFDRTRYRVLVTRAQSHDPEARGPAIMTTAYGREPIIVVRVDIASGKVTGVDTPPPHVHWGDISTPLF